MSKIKAGTYTVGEILQKADFDFASEAAAEYNGGGPDHRRVQIGGLGFDSLYDTIVIPVTADTVTITLDGAEHTTLEVTHDDEQLAERKLAFEVAAEADDPRTK